MADAFGKVDKTLNIDNDDEMLDIEEDFPRENLSRVEKNKNYKKKYERTEKKQRSPSKSDYEDVWKRPITAELLTEGVLGLGVINRIKETEILLECSNGVIVVAPITNFGSALIETLQNSSLELENVFQVGQMLAFKVMKPRHSGSLREPGKNSYPIVCCDPLIVNFHLNPGNLINGLVLNGSVDSIEDKGVIINLGLQSVELKGFLPEKNLPPSFQKESLLRGQLLLLRVEHESSSKNMRVVNLSGIPELDTLSDVAVQNLKLNDLMPGTILWAQPLKLVARGVYVDIGNGIRGFVSNLHSPPRYHADASKCLKPFRVVVMLCQQNSNLVAFNGQPDIVAISRFTKRINFEGIRIGDIINCKVTDCNKNGSVNFSLMLGDGSKNSLKAFATNTRLEDGTIYKTGTVHQARVLSYKMVERVLIVTTRKDILAQKMVSVKDSTVGERITGKVISVSSKGLYVKVYDTIHGFIPKIQLSDKLITQINKHFFVGDEIKCRILSLDRLKTRLILTSKESLITSSDAIIKSYIEVSPGMVSMGYVTCLHPSGGLIMGFYGGTRAFMFPKEVERLGTNIKIGLTVRIRVVSVDPQNERMLVAVADEFSDKNRSVKAQPFIFEKEDPVSFMAVVNGFTSMGRSCKFQEMLNVVLRLKKKMGGKVEATISKELLSDCLELPFSSLSENIALGSILPKVAVLGVVAGNLKITTKRFMIEWLESHERITSIEMLMKGKLVCGSVVRKHPEIGYFVELAGGSALTAPARFVRPEALSLSLQQLQIGQTVVARVSSVDVDRKRFALILDPKFCVPSNSEPDYFAPSLMRCALEELNWFAANNPSKFDVPRIGSCIDVNITDFSENSINIQVVGSGIKGAAVNNSTDMLKVLSNEFQKGSRSQALVLDIKFPSFEVDVLLLKNGFQNMDEEKLKSILRCQKILDATVWLRKKEYIVATVKFENFIFVTCIPRRLHPNLDVIPEKPDENRNFCTIVPKLVFGDVMIGTAVNMSEINQLNKKQIKVQKKTTVKKKLKQFWIYKAKVVGIWSKEGKSHSSVELELPGGTLGRLHASEFDDSFLNQSSQPVQSFLKKMKGKVINIKIMFFSKVREKMKKKSHLETKEDDSAKEKKITIATRIAECTMKMWKLNETKKKQSLLGYPKTYTYGSLIPVFVCEGPHLGVVKVEASPLWNGVIRKQNLTDENLISNPANETSALIDIDFEPGEKLIAQVIGINVFKKRSGRSRHRKCLELTLKETRKVFEEGDVVIGRIVGITQSPTTIIFELPNNQRAVLTLTSITDCYLKAFEAAQNYELNQVYKVKLLRFENDTGRWIAITETYRNLLQHANGVLYRNGVEIESELQAFVVSNADNDIIVEISPGILGRLKKYKFSLQPDDLIKVCTTHVQDQDGVLRLRFIGLIVNNVPKKRPRKRFLSVGSDTGSDSSRKKSKKAGYMAKGFKEDDLQRITHLEAKIPEPGLDWSLEGFSPAEFANVGQIIGKMENAENSSSLKEEDFISEVEDTSKTKEQLQIDKEKKLMLRERQIIEADWIPDSSHDFDRLVAGSPNSSMLWIRYITFFLERNEIEKARAIAERALAAINFREEDEIFNIWTAYLNLEANFGTDDSLKTVFDRAIRNTDSLKMCKQMVKIYQNVGKTEVISSVLLIVYFIILICNTILAQM
ncbi:unnamed protein product [Thelazia callipaeda]|uniref:S1 motif domain-containing protein n=1 Tax=Thelazia callipaeda TaxID=103827 RepID=A0A0N5CZH0_THECL|nr:unnamed protein product [Thelazia callipaeda]